MKVHLVRSEEVDLKLVRDVIDILRSVPGPINFCTNVDSAINFLEDETESQILREEDFTVMTSLMKMRLKISREEDHAIVFPLERATATWDALFKKSATYRKENNIPADEFVLLLTDVANERN